MEWFIAVGVVVLTAVVIVGLFHGPSHPRPRPSASHGLRASNRRHPADGSVPEHDVGAGTAPATGPAGGPAGPAVGALGTPAAEAGVSRFAADGTDSEPQAGAAPPAYVLPPPPSRRRRVVRRAADRRPGRRP